MVVLLVVVVILFVVVVIVLVVIVLLLLFPQAHAARQEYVAPRLRQARRATTVHEEPQSIPPLSPGQEPHGYVLWVARPSIPDVS